MLRTCYGGDIEVVRVSENPGLLLAILLGCGNADFCEAVYVRYPGLFVPEDADDIKVKNSLPLPAVQVWAAKTFGFDLTAHWAHWAGVSGVVSVKTPF